MIDSAKNAYKVQKYAEALKIFLELYQRQPENLLVLEGLAKSYFRLKKVDKALEICNRALSIDPGLAWPHIVKSQIHFPKKMSACKEEAAIAIETAPSNWESNFWWGSVLCYDNKIDEGVIFLEKAASIETNEWAIYNNLATAYYKKKFFRKYYWALEEMNKLRPSFFISYMIAFGKLFKLNTRE